MRTPFAVLLGAVLAAATPALAARPVVPTLEPSQLQPGQRAVVRTVFEGARIDSFEAEIVGLFSGGRAEGEMIVARATTPRVVQSGVAAGMSGSPVYVDGRLIGALSSGWAFSREPLFGITPIGEMLAVLDLPTRPGVEPTSGPSGIDAPGASASDLAVGPLRWSDPAPEDLVRRAATPPAASAASSLTRLSLPLSGALQPAAAAILDPFFRAAGLQLVGGARGAAKVPAVSRLEPGSAVAVDVLRGDLQLAAIGTVTYVDGNHVLIFGHPFFQAGDVRLPLSTASITTIVASQQNSFKLGQRGTEIGLATQDRRAAVAGELGVRARLMPIAIDVARPDRPIQKFRFESVEDRALGPLLLSAATLNSVLESGGTSASQTLRWSLDLHRRGAPALKIADVVSGDAPINDLSAGMMAPVRFLLNNPFERVSFDSIHARIEIEPRRVQWTLRSARLLGTAVRPGAVAKARVELESWRGERRDVDLDVHVPEELPDGGYVLFLGGGLELSRYESQRLPSRYRPTSLDDAWLRLQQLRPNGALYAALVASAPEVTRRGRDYPELPLSALAVLATGTAAGDASRRGDAAIVDERRHPMDGPVRGEILLPLRVDRAAP